MKPAGKRGLAAIVLALFGHHGCATTVAPAAHLAAEAPSQPPLPTIEASTVVTLEPPQIVDKVTIYFPGKLVPMREVLPRLGPVRSEMESALAARAALHKAQRDVSMANIGEGDFYAARSARDAAEAKEHRVFEQTRKALEGHLTLASADRVATLLALEHLRSDAADESTASFGFPEEVNALGFGPHEYVKKWDARCEAALKASGPEDPLRAWLTNCVDRQRYLALRPGSAGATLMKAAAADDEAFIAAAPTSVRAALHARRALRLAFANDLPAALRALEAALDAEPDKAPSRRQLLQAAASISTQLADDESSFALALESFAEGIPPGDRKALDRALDAWVRTGAALDPTKPGARQFMAYASLFEVARGREQKAKELAHLIGEDPAACGLTGAYFPDIPCAQRPSLASKTIDQNMAAFWVQTFRDQLGGGSAPERVLKSAARACARGTTQAQSGGEVYTRDSAQPVGTCIRRAMDKLLPKIPYSVSVQLQR